MIEPRAQEPEETLFRLLSRLALHGDLLWLPAILLALSREGYGIEAPALLVVTPELARTWRKMTA